MMENETDLDFKLDTEPEPEPELGYSMPSENQRSSRGGL
jgi:hypothetical protein